MPHEELRDHPDVAGILYMTLLCKQTLIWTHVHTHYQVTRSGIRAGRVRAQTIRRAWAVTAPPAIGPRAAEHATLPLRAERANMWQTYPVGPPRGELKLCSHADRETVGRWGGITQDSRSARDIDAASVLVPAKAAEASKRVSSSRETIVPGVVVIGPGVARRSTARMEQTRAEMGGRAHRGDESSCSALTVCPLLATATRARAGRDPCSSGM